jgi:hypothetical protein
LTYHTSSQKISPLPLKKEKHLKEIEWEEDLPICSFYDRNINILVSFSIESRHSALVFSKGLPKTNKGSKDPLVCCLLDVCSRLDDKSRNLGTHILSVI